MPVPAGSYRKYTVEKFRFRSAFFRISYWRLYDRDDTNASKRYPMKSVVGHKNASRGCEWQLLENRSAKADQNRYCGQETVWD